jgi:hypothetical protein
MPKYKVDLGDLDVFVEVEAATPEHAAREVVEEYEAAQAEWPSAGDGVAVGVFQGNCRWQFTVVSEQQPVYRAIADDYVR